MFNTMFVSTDNQPTKTNWDPNSVLSNVNKISSPNWKYSPYAAISQHFLRPAYFNQPLLFTLPSTPPNALELLQTTFNRRNKKALPRKFRTVKFFSLSLYLLFHYFHRHDFLFFPFFSLPITSFKTLLQYTTNSKIANNIFTFETPQIKAYTITWHGTLHAANWI